MARIEFEGNLGHQPDLRFTRGGDPILAFRVADSKSRKTESGEWETISEQWLNVSVWGPLAEHLSARLDKGTRVRVVGEFYVREYEHNGEMRQSLDVKAWGVDVLTRRNGQGAARPQASRPARQQPAAANDPWGQQQSAAPANDPWAQQAFPAHEEPPF